MKTNQPSTIASPSSSEILCRLMLGISGSVEGSAWLEPVHIQLSGIVEDTQIGVLKQASPPKST